MISTKNLRTIVAGAIVTLAASAAQAAPVFTVDPTSNGVSTPATSFQADSMTGGSSARIVYTGNGTSTYTYTGTGYIDYTAFQLTGEGGLSAKTTGLNYDYGLYATFTQTFSCTGFLGTGSSCTVTSIKLSLFEDVNDKNKYTAATVNSDYAISSTGTQVLLGTVDEIVSGAAGIDSLGGAFQNVNTNFELTDEGKDFFISPNPFYSFAYSAFNNTSTGLSCNGDTTLAANGCAGQFTAFAINQESGITDFNVPEPASVAIFGAGLMGLAVLRRRRKV